MAVWTIPASGPEAQENYPKTLTSSISESRKKEAAKYIGPLIGDCYAWGFPLNDVNKGSHSNMEEGDICFFLCDLDGEGRGSYRFAARVSKIVPQEIAKDVSEAFWDDPEFLPYLIGKPIALNVTPQQFGEHLNGEKAYKCDSPQQSQRIVDEKRAWRAISTYGSLEEWALAFIEKYSTEALSEGVESVLGYGDDAGSLRKSEESLIKQKKRASKDSNTSGSNGGRSRRAKFIGDIGEEAVFEYLKNSLPKGQVETLRWVADEGEKPGYDIEYVDGDGELQGIEVKSTVASKFSSFDITVKELKCAEKMGSNYQLYLVANCLKPKKRVFEVIADPAEALSDRLQPSVYRFV